MDRFSDMALFVAVVDAGGLAAGGSRLGLSPATVSARIAALEARSGSRLLVRTTRSLSLTDEGRIYLEAARNILAEVDDLDARLRDGAERISGRLRIAAPLDLGRNRIAPILDAFMARHPDIAVELILSDGISELVGEGIDFAVRYGALADSSMIVRRIGGNRRVVCAAPGYLAQHGRPETPDDLAQHNCLVMLFGNQPNDRWRFRVGDREVVVPVRGNRSANDGELIRSWAIAGHGLALKSIWDVSEDLASGRLVELLAPFALPGNALQLLYPAGRPPPRRSRALMDAIVTGLASAEGGVSGEPG